MGWEGAHARVLGAQGGPCPRWGGSVAGVRRAGGVPSSRPSRAPSLPPGAVAQKAVALKKQQQLLASCKSLPSTPSHSAASTPVGGAHPGQVPPAAQPCPPLPGRGPGPVLSPRPLQASNGGHTSDYSSSLPSTPNVSHRELRSEPPAPLGTPSSLHRGAKRRTSLFAVSGQRGAPGCWGGDTGGGVTRHVGCPHGAGGTWHRGDPRQGGDGGAGGTAVGTGWVAPGPSQQQGAPGCPPAGPGVPPPPSPVPSDAPGQRLGEAEPGQPGRGGGQRPRHPHQAGRQGGGRWGRVCVPPPSPRPRPPHRPPVPRASC